MIKLEVNLCKSNDIIIYHDDYIKHNQKFKYIKDLNQTICYTKDDNKKFVDSIGAGDTYLAGFISSLLLNMGDLPSMIYADIVAHISTTKLGTLKEISKEEVDKEYLRAETSLTDMEDVLYVHCSFNDD